MSNKEPAQGLGYSFVFRLEFRADEHRVHEQTLGQTDFDRAVCATTFDALRNGKTSQYNPMLEAAIVEPLFANANSPRTRGFVVKVALPSGESHQREFGIDYFSSTVSRLQARLTREGKLEQGEAQLTYYLSAYTDDVVADTINSKLPISLESPRFNLRIREGGRFDFENEISWDDPISKDVAVAIDQSVLEQAVEEARNTLDKEVGGILLGHVMRKQNGEIFVLVTGLASGAGTTEASATSVTFTPDTFSETQNIVRLRGADEMIVGWFHSHPFRFCAACPLPAPPECIDKVLFYSQDDVHLMERTFDQPFMVGLLAAVEPLIESAIGHLPVRLYGWRDGSVRQRGFHVTDLATHADAVPDNQHPGNQNIAKEETI